METNVIDSKRIAKNTILLYIRQILIMIVALYTSRIVLLTLGIMDFGIFNVIAGIVTMFSFLMSTMASASQRYLSYDLASGNMSLLKETFGLIMLSYVLLAIISIIMVECFGVWFLNTHMTIPHDRLYAANYVLQFSILAFVAQIFATPYMAIIIAREKMDVYAYLSIADVILKLLIVYLLLAFNFDKLILYSFLLFLSSCLITFSYYIYCHIYFDESKYKFVYKKKKFYEIVVFAWWNMIGALSNLMRSQGINILLSMFFNPVVNAARGIAFQVNSAITSFSNNYFTAVRPQVIKSYAVSEYYQMRELILSSSRMSFYLMLIIALPVYLKVDQVMQLWLKTPPEYTSLFVRLILINALIEVYSLPLVTGLQATEKIKTYQLTVSVIYLLSIPISYIYLNMGYPPETPMYINIVLVIVCFAPRLFLCKKYYHLSIITYIRKVLMQTFVVACLSYITCRLVLTPIKGTDILSLVLSLIVSFLIIGIIVFYVGFTSSERNAIYSFLQKRIMR